MAPISKGLGLWVSETVLNGSLGHDCVCLAAVAPRPMRLCLHLGVSTACGHEQGTHLPSPHQPPPTITAPWRSWFPGLRDPSGLKYEVRGGEVQDIRSWLVSHRQ